MVCDFVSLNFVFVTLLDGIQTIYCPFTGVRGKAESVHKHGLQNDGGVHIGLSSGSTTGGNLEAELARVHVMLAHNSKVYKVFVYIHALYFIFNFVYIHHVSYYYLDYC